MIVYLNIWILILIKALNNFDLSICEIFIVIADILEQESKNSIQLQMRLYKKRKRRAGENNNYWHLVNWSVLPAPMDLYALITVIMYL